VTVRPVIVEADGGSRGNPGPAGYGAVVRDAETGEVLAERKGSIGIDTNNVAEYQGLIAGLQAAAELGATDVVVRMDSRLVVEQMSGHWQVKHPSMRSMATRATALARGFDSISFGWIPRAQNSLADRLANQAMDAAADELVQPVGEKARPVPEQLEFDPAPQSAPATSSAVWAPGAAPATRFILLRHGATEYSPAHRFAGRSDLDLTPAGIEQARQAAERVAELAEVAAVYSSPLLRARHTARLLAERLGLPVAVEDGLIETDFGDWDGYTHDEVRQKWPAELGRWLADPLVAPPGGESLAVTIERVRQAADRIRARHVGESVVLVSHVWPIKALIQLALGAPPIVMHRMYLSAAAISTIDYRADGTALLTSFNATGQLTS
jgi:ribonuclease H / adenosylcobalamin/alpha-ribazole phosphatase